MRIIDPRIYVEQYDGIKIMKNIESACRTCYRSENLISEDSYKKLLRNCITRGHESVLEHEKITIKMICDIGVYKDLTRHRFGSFSIESTRYCNYGKDKFDNEIKFIKPVFYTPGTIESYTDVTDKTNCLKTQYWVRCMEIIEEHYMDMLKNTKATPDELRMILPHSTAAQVTMTANIREWKHILDLRTKQMTHPSIQQLLIPLLLKFKEDMPDIFESIDYNTNFDSNKYAKLEVCKDWTELNNAV